MRQVSIMLICSMYNLYAYIYQMYQCLSSSSASTFKVHWTHGSTTIHTTELQAVHLSGLQTQLVPSKPREARLDVTCLQFNIFQAIIRWSQRKVKAVQDVRQNEPHFLGAMAVQCEELGCGVCLACGWGRPAQYFQHPYYQLPSL